jgi:hypothetical protein
MCFASHTEIHLQLRTQSYGDIKLAELVSVDKDQITMKLKRFARKTLKLQHERLLFLMPIYACVRCKQSQRKSGVYPNCRKGSLLDN